MEKWIVFVEVVPVPENDGFGEEGLGAFTYLVGLAPDKDTFTAKAMEYLTIYGFVLLEMEEIEQLDKNRFARITDPLLLDAIANLTNDECIGAGTYFKYPLTPDSESTESD